MQEVLESEFESPTYLLAIKLFYLNYSSDDYKKSTVGTDGFEPPIFWM